MADKRRVSIDYERIRNEKVARNNSILQQYGVLKLAGNLSQKSKKKRSKAKEKTGASEDIENYNPNTNSGSDEEFDPLNFEPVSKTGGRRQLRVIPNEFTSASQRQQRNSRTELELTGDAERLSSREKFTDQNVTMADILLRSKQLLRSSAASNKHVATKPSSSSILQGLEDDALFNEYEDEENNANSDYADSDAEYDDALFNEDEEEEEEANLHNKDLEEGNSATMKRKTRGPTMLHDVQTRTKDKRLAIILNEFGQPIGPGAIADKKSVVGEFARFCGTVGHNYSYAPLTIADWRKVPDKERMWEFVLLKYIVPPEGKEWVLKTIGSCWRVYKCRFKKAHYYAYTDDKSRWKNRPKTVSDEDFLQLLSKWKKKTEKMRCARNREHRLAQRNMHTVGAKSFAVVREEMRNEHPNKEAPSLAELFERTRTRTEGKKYIDSYDDTAKKIEDMKHYVAPQDGSGPSDAYVGVMGKGYNGSCRMYGRGVSNKKLKMVNGDSSYVVPGEILESFKSSLMKDLKEDMDSQINERNKRLEDEHSKKMAELENKGKELENNQKELDAERENMTDEILQKILQKLPPEIVKQYLKPN